MELWIRTQDRECIMKVDRLDIDGKKICANGFGVNLGEYKSYERALEVLDEIQSILFYKKMSEDDVSLFAKIITEKYDDELKNKIYMDTAIYQMPKE